MYSFEAGEIDTLYGKNWAIVGFVVQTLNGEITVDLTDEEKSAVCRTWGGEDDPGINSIFQTIKSKAIQPKGE